MKKKILLQYFIIVYVIISGCRKNDFLDARPNSSIGVPATLADMQAILDNDKWMNGAGHSGIVPSFGETGADNYFITDDRFNSSLKPLEQNAYTWAKDIYSGEPVYDWDLPYKSIFYANVVLDGLNNFSPGNDPAEWNNLKGSALFYRAHLFYQLAQVFAAPYNSGTAATDWGIPLRVQADINEKISRATVAQTYRQVLADLKESAALLPRHPLYKTRPSQPAAYALLARVYQTMGDDDSALTYADSCLANDSSLVDYNSLDTGSLTPFPQFNSEVLFNCTLQTTDVVPFIAGAGTIDSNLYRSYDANDLRKTLFFKTFYGAVSFTGSYDGSFYPFAGLATDEVYLIKAECEAGKGNTPAALQSLNTLMEKRWRTGTFVPFTASNADDALRIILTERRKELVMRGLRWTDLRRLNGEPRFAVTLKRMVDGQIYTLPPGDPRYTYPIPDDVIGFNPGMPQNPR